MKINNNQNPIELKKEIGKEGKTLAKDMMIFADKNYSAVSTKTFQEQLSKMEKLNPSELVYFINNFDEDESIIELIVDEVSNTKEDRKKLV